MKDILQNTTEIVVAFEKVMEGNAIGVFQLLDKIRKSVNCIRDAMFYEKISALMNELDSHQTDKRKIWQLQINAPKHTALPPEAETNTVCRCPMRHA